jgi:hypothetical protein
LVNEANKDYLAKTQFIKAIKIIAIYQH